MATSQAIIVDYQAGNVESVQRACDAVGIDALISADPDLIRKAERLIFPGVGTAESAVNTLHKTGIWDALLDFADAGRPLLGICLGAQILLEQTEEGDQACLGLLPGKCRRFSFEDAALKVLKLDGTRSISILTTRFSTAFPQVLSSTLSIPTSSSACTPVMSWVRLRMGIKPSPVSSVAII